MKKGLLGIAVLFAILTVLEGIWLMTYPQNLQFIIGFGTAWKSQVGFHYVLLYLCSIPIGFRNTEG